MSVAYKPLGLFVGRTLIPLKQKMFYEKSYIRIIKKQILSNLAIVVLHSFEFECQVCQRKEKSKSLLEYRHSPLVVTADNRDGSGLQVWDLFNGSVHVSNKKKKGGTIKHKNKNDTSISLPRYQRVRPKYGQSALHLSSGRKNKQALRGAHKTLHPAGIAFSGLTAWGLNPHKGLKF